MSQRKDCGNSTTPFAAPQGRATRNPRRFQGWHVPVSRGGIEGRETRSLDLVIRSFASEAPQVRLGWRFAYCLATAAI